jgi:Fe-S cluster assembly protein SufD
VSDRSGLRVHRLEGVFDEESLRCHLGKVPGAAAASFGELNTALFEDVALVTVAPDFVVEEPVHLLFLSSRGDGVPFVTHPRVFVFAGRGSEATVVETHAGLDGVSSFTNAVTELVVADGACLDHIRLQREGDSAFHIGALAARLGRDSRLRSVTVSLGAALSRLDLSVCFDAPGGDATLDGLFMADGARHVDIHSRVEHRVPHCTSQQLYKGILDDTARGVFNGLVVVEKGAQKTDAAQANRNLLLSRGALVHSTPQLLILADDVKCKHGSTTGQLDEVALFYLRSRGIGEEAARSLLTYAFASDIVHRIRVESVRAGVEKLLAVHLRDAAVVREAFA